MQTDVLLYSFRNYRGKTYNLLNQIEFDSFPKLFIYGKNGPARLINFVRKNNFKHVIGFGDYRKNAKRIRIEGKFINRYGKTKLVESLPQIIDSDLGLNLIENTYISNLPTWGPCNRSGFLLKADIIANPEQYNSTPTVNFIHIPRGLDLKTLTPTILKLIQSFT